MFDFAGSEIALVAVVALILIGPKDLPIAIKAVTGVIKKARRMASEFQVHVDDMMRDADMGELRTGLNDLRRMDIKGKILSAIDDDGTVRKSVADVKDVATGASSSWMPPPAPVPEVAATPVASLPEHGIATPDLTAVPDLTTVPAFGDMVPVSSGAPSFIPPGAARTPPSFIPPGAARA